MCLYLESLVGKTRIAIPSRRVDDRGPRWSLGSQHIGSGGARYGPPLYLTPLLIHLAMNFVGVADEGPVAASGTKNVFSEFPGENPAQAELNAWLDAWHDDWTTHGYAAHLRGEVHGREVGFRSSRVLQLTRTR